MIKMFSQEQMTAIMKLNEIQPFVVEICQKCGINYNRPMNELKKDLYYMFMSLKNAKPQKPVLPAEYQHTVRNDFGELTEFEKGDEYQSIETVDQRKIKLRSKRAMKDPPLNTEQNAIAQIIQAEIDNYLDKTVVIGVKKPEKCGVVFLLEAPPGTGKSFLVSTICRNNEFNLSAKVVVYRKSLVTDYIKNGVTSVTNFRFFNTFFGFSNYGEDEDTIKFQKMKEQFNDESTLERSMMKAYFNSFQIYLKEEDVLFFDEYTIMPPWTIVALMLSAIRCKKIMIFVGDSQQLNSIGKSIYHGNKTNRSVISVFSKTTLELRQQMRINDEEYLNTLLDFKSKMNSECDIDTEFTFNLLYFLYLRLKRKFFTNNLEAAYIASTHASLKDRQGKIVRKWDTELTLNAREMRENGKEPSELERELHFVNFKFVHTTGKLIDIKESEDQKYITNFPLYINKVYVYRNKMFVRLLAVIGKSLLVEPLSQTDRTEIEQNNNNMRNGLGTTFLVHLRPVKELELHTEVKAWLGQKKSERGSEIDDVVGYDIRLPLFTYHGVQGSTISNYGIVLNLNQVQANSVYVGLSRIRSSDQLIGLQTSLLTSLIYTELRNDGYFYKVPYLNHSLKSKIINIGRVSCTDATLNIPNDLQSEFKEYVTQTSNNKRKRNEVILKTTTDAIVFNRYKYNIRIKIEDYERTKDKIPKYTLLQDVLEFFKANQHLIFEEHPEEEVLLQFERYKQKMLIEKTLEFTESIATSEVPYDMLPFVKKQRLSDEADDQFAKPSIKKEK